jgi:hypothetical protein
MLRHHGHAGRSQRLSRQTQTPFHRALTPTFSATQKQTASKALPPFGLAVWPHCAPTAVANSSQKRSAKPDLRVKLSGNMPRFENLPKTYFFIDESGDPSFYASGNKCIVGTQGFKPLLLIGLVRLENKKAIRNAIIQFMDEVKNNPLYNMLPCIADSKDWYLHASYDNLEIRVKFAELLQKMDGFEFYCVIGRKNLDIFLTKHNRSESEFYFDLITHLIKGRLVDENIFYQILLSARKKNTQHKLKESIQRAIQSDNAARDTPFDIKYNCEIVLSKETPELCIADYLLWSIQRYLLLGDKRFYKALEAKYNLIIDLYGSGPESPDFYDSANPLDLSKLKGVRADGYS